MKIYLLEIEILIKYQWKLHAFTWLLTTERYIHRFIYSLFIWYCVFPWNVVILLKSARSVDDRSSERSGVQLILTPPWEMPPTDLYRYWRTRTQTIVKNLRKATIYNEHLLTFSQILRTNSFSNEREQIWKKIKYHIPATTNTSNILWNSYALLRVFCSSLSIFRLNMFSSRYLFLDSCRESRAEGEWGEKWTWRSNLSCFQTVIYDNKILSFL